MSPETLPKTGGGRGRPDEESARVRRIYDRAAGSYDKTIGFWERIFFGGGRAWVCAQAQGDVLEIAIGTGRNLPYYPRDVHLAGIDVSPAMLEIARKRAAESARVVDLRVADAQALPFPDGSFDVVVSTLSLCTIPDERRAIVEARRVLRPGGRLLWLEHVRSPLGPVRVIERLLEPLAVRFQADHLLREPLDSLQTAGWQIEQLERARWGVVERGAARKQA
jgi:ubiquinone/menaquinone biosynthesis C-methylase UbiE